MAGLYGVVAFVVTSRSAASSRSRTAPEYVCGAYPVQPEAPIEMVAALAGTRLLPRGRRGCSRAEPTGGRVQSSIILSFGPVWAKPFRR